MNDNTKIITFPVPEQKTEHHSTLQIEKDDWLESVEDEYDDTEFLKGSISAC